LDRTIYSDVVDRIMPDKEQQDRPLSERVVREAVGVGMESPMRETILEAVEEAEGGEAVRQPSLPIAGALVGLGAAFGYLLGMGTQQSIGGEQSVLESVEEPEIVDETVEQPDETETVEEAEEPDGTGSRLPKVVLGLGIAAGIALLRRRMTSSDDEWEPIEEFDTSIGDETESESEDETDTGIQEAEDEDVEE
jgi:hypothetical protein